MAKATAPVCTCGAAYDSSGVCTRCGKKRPRSGGYCLLHTVLCALGALILFFCLGNTHALRTYLSSDALTESLREARISDAAVPFTGKNVTELIMQNYVTDSNVTAENVAAAADNMQIPAFLAGKLEGHFALLRNTSDTPVTISADEITAELDRISDSLAETGGIIVDDTDRAQIEQSLGGVLGKINGLSTAFGSNKAGRAVQRFGVSVWAYVLALILLGLLFVRWCSVRKNSGRDIAGAIKGLGLTALIPSALGLIPVLIGGIRTWFIKDGTVGLNGVSKVLRGPYWFITITGVTFGIFLLELAALLRDRAAYKKKQDAEQAEPVPLDPRPALPAEAFDMPAAAEYQSVLNKTCASCGKSLDASAKFCIYCGTEQTASAAADTDGAPEAQPDDPAVQEI
ncbi:MAG: zinc ribbon domain-containing protein [Oscillospiraceae bacterium]|nr:zinc ribbon domain-containing protein [Oscillospiraceae bacterium]